MPQMQGIDALSAIQSALPKARVVIVSGDQNPLLVRQCIEHGAAGFIAKDSPTTQLYHALQVMIGGGVYLPTLTTQTDAALSGYVRDLISFTQYFPALSPRQCEVFKAMARGLSNKAIARELSITEDTVKQHLSAVYQVLSVSSRTEAVYLISQLGLIIT